MKLIHPHKKIYVKNENEKKVKNKQRTKLKIKKKNKQIHLSLNNIKKIKNISNYRIGE
jgi:hypothetical protein